MDQHTSALLRLVQAHWTVAPVGDPFAPVMLVYTRLLPDGGGVDEVVVTDTDDVRAIRRIGATVVREEFGTAVVVVDAALGWPPAEEIGRAAS